MIVSLIVIAEIAFWVLVAAGLFARYALRRRRLGAILLAATPVVDLMLLTFAAVDIQRGAEFQGQHALAAIYLGVSIAFGPDMMRWADRKVAQQFGGQPPAPPVSSVEHAARERRGWLKHALAWSIGTGTLAFLYVLAGLPDDPERFFQLSLTWLVILAIDFVWSFSYTLFPRRERPCT